MAVAQVGDTIVKADGKAVPHFSALQHLLGPKYEGDTVTLTVKRDDKEVELAPATLLGSSPAYVNAFLGILPMRSDTVAGVGVRYVYPKSAAAETRLIRRYTYSPAAIKANPDSDIIASRACGERKRSQPWS